MRTHLFAPQAEGRYPGIGLYSEIYQITEPGGRNGGVSRRWGFYVVSAPEVYHEYEARRVRCWLYDAPGTDRGNALKFEKTVAAYDSDARTSLDHREGASGVQRQARRQWGICLGGHLAFRAAMNPDVAAAACFYATDIHTGSLGHGDDSPGALRATSRASNCSACGADRTCISR